MDGGIAHFLAMAGTLAAIFGLLAARDYYFGDRADRDVEDDDLMIDNPSPPPPRPLSESAPPGETPTQRYRHRRIVERDTGGWAVLYPGDPGYEDEPPGEDEPPHRGSAPLPTDRPLVDAMEMIRDGYAWVEVVQMLMREHGQTFGAARGIARRARRKVATQ